MTEARLQKLLAQAGYGSRRACEELIVQGRVRVNGRPAVLGQKADEQTDRIEVDGQPLGRAEQLTYVALHKPRGVISSLSPQGERRTVRDLVDLPGRLYPVGRLDLHSEGLMLLTNDGSLTQQLTHPRYGHEKEYRVLVRGRIAEDDARLGVWGRGVVLAPGVRSAPANVDVERSLENATWLRITMTEGRKHEIRDIGTHLGMPVQRIVRVRLGTLKLGDLKAGQWRVLADWEVARLKGGQASAAEARGRGRNEAGVPGRTASRRSLQRRRSS